MLFCISMFCSNPYFDSARAPLNFPEIERVKDGNIQLKYVDLDLRCEETISPFSGERNFVVLFEKGNSKSEVENCKNSGVSFIAKVEKDCYLLKLSYNDLSKILKKGGKVFYYKPQYKIDPLINANWQSPLIVECVIKKDACSKEIIEMTKKKFFIGNISFSDQFERWRWLVEGKDAKQFAEEISKFEEVLLVYPWFLPTPLNDDSIWVIQSYDTTDQRNYALSATIFNHGILGDGEIATVCDTGLDNDMCYFAYNLKGYAVAQYPPLSETGNLDFSKKVICYSVLPGATAYDNNQICNAPNEFHGTHTSCTLVGDNFKNLATLANIGHDTADGMAPMAKLYFQDAGDDVSGCLLGLANDYKKIFEQSYKAGARIHSDSWGSNSDGDYTADSFSVDKFIYDNDDFTICIAAGNSGYIAQSINTPATAKNCIAVGSLTHGSVLSDAVSSFSSKGPTKDGRIKPDLCAPGENVLSASGDDSSQDGNCSYKSMSGTSMATPTLAGGAVLIRNYFTKGFYPSGSASSEDSFSPSSALIKASLIGGAMDVGSNDFPNFNEGFGRINLDRFCYFKENDRDNLREIAYDVRNYAGLKEGEEFSFEIPASNNLKVVLVWSDPPSPLISLKTLVNDLDLEVVSPSQRIYRGNNLVNGFSVDGGTKDSLNNVEMVNIQNGESGLWTIKVKGSDIEGTLDEPYSQEQGFALVVIKDSSFVDLPSPSNLIARDNGDSGIELKWDLVDGATSYSVYRIEKAGAKENSQTFLGTSTTNNFIDTKIQGGFLYSYFVRTSKDGFEGKKSSEVTISSTGNCTLLPSFDGVQSGESDSTTLECSVTLHWNEGHSNCPLSNEISYNIYRGTTPDFEPSSQTLIAKSVKDLSYKDSSIPYERTFYYIVRCEDSTKSNDGPSGGNEDKNLKFINLTPEGESEEMGPIKDDGGDTFAFCKLEEPFTISKIQNHTPSGNYCYSLSKNGETYPSNTCASLTLENVKVALEDSLLSYYVNYNLEYGWDGVVVEVSEDNGVTFNPLPPYEGYPSSFSMTGDPPINSCKFPYNQGCFSGPQSNLGLSGWHRYSNSLNNFVGKTLFIRWRFSSDPASEFDGFFLDDIEISGIYKNSSCLGTEPKISFDKTKYNCDDTVKIELSDYKATNLSEVTIFAKSDEENEYEEIELYQTSPQSGIFEGTTETTSQCRSGDKKLCVKDGDSIYAYYIKEGQILNEANSQIDCSLPSITLLSYAMSDPIDVEFTILTNEPTTLFFEYGRQGNLQYSINDDAFTDEHSFTLNDLSFCTDYSYKITLKDYAGNSYSTEIKTFSTKGCYEKPIINSVKTIKDPFRLAVSGEHFLKDSQILVNGRSVPETKYKGATKLIGKKGSDLKSLLPKGRQVEIKVFNRSDLTYSEPFYFTR